MLDRFHSSFCSGRDYNPAHKAFIFKNLTC